MSRARKQPLDGWKRTCPDCGGMHFGSLKCPFIKAACVICGDQTILACSDCAIDSGGKASVHVCQKSECRDRHEMTHAKNVVGGPNGPR